MCDVLEHLGDGVESFRRGVRGRYFRGQDDTAEMPFDPLFTFSIALVVERPRSRSDSAALGSSAARRPARASRAVATHLRHKNLQTASRYIDRRGAGSRALKALER